MFTYTPRVSTISLYMNFSALCCSYCLALLQASFPSQLHEYRLPFINQGTADRNHQNYQQMQLPGSYYKNMTEFDYLLKFIIIGDTGVGKSCIVTQFIEQKMSIEHQVTLGVQFASRIVNLNNKYVKLQVWDTAGQQNFRSITRSYYRSAIGALLIYDITKKKSFQHLKDWIKQIKNNGSQNIQILLLGNKSDLQTHRQVTATQGRKFADQNGLQWLQISAKDYPKVQTAFLKLTRQITNMIEKGQINETTPGVKINQSQKIDPIGDGGFTRRHCC